MTPCTVCLHASHIALPQVRQYAVAALSGCTVQFMTVSFGLGTTSPPTYIHDNPPARNAGRRGYSSGNFADLVLALASCLAADPFFDQAFHPSELRLVSIRALAFPARTRTEGSRNTAPLVRRHRNNCASARSGAGPLTLRTTPSIPQRLTPALWKRMPSRTTS